MFAFYSSTSQVQRSLLELRSPDWRSSKAPPRAPLWKGGIGTEPDCGCGAERYGQNPELAVEKSTSNIGPIDPISLPPVSIGLTDKERRDSPGFRGFEICAVRMGLDR